MQHSGAPPDPAIDRKGGGSGGKGHARAPARRAKGRGALRDGYSAAKSEFRPHGPIPAGVEPFGYSSRCYFLGIGDFLVAACCSR